MGCAGNKEAQDTTKIGGVVCGTHLGTPADLTGMPKFPEGTKSLLCKHLDPKLWE